MLIPLLPRHSTCDANSNYKPVDQMNPEEIKKELERMPEESLKE